MADDLDHMLERLSRLTSAAAKDDLENQVLAELARRRAESSASRALTPIRAVSVGLALAVGVATGGIAAVADLAETHRLNAFSAGPHLAPSTLLEGRG